MQRIEVFSGSGRRRRWTAEQKALIVAETFVTGEKCGGAVDGLTPQQLFTWRREFSGCGQRKPDGICAGGFGDSSIVRGRRADGSRAIGGLVAIEIVIGAATVRVPPGTEPRPCSSFCAR